MRTRDPRKSWQRLATAFVVCLGTGLGTASAQPNPLEGFDGYVSRAVGDWEAPGLAVTVVKDGELVFGRGYGVRKLGAPEPVDEHTLFAIGSTTKAMTATALGLLVDEGKLQWDDPVRKHLPDFELYDPYVTRELTVRDLLTHRSGLPGADFLWYGQDHSISEILQRLRFLEPETSLRSHFTYQNIMYAAAGQVVAAASGMPWARFVRRRILEPVGMSDTVTTLAEAQRRPNVAFPHDRVDGRVTPIENMSVDAIAPAGAIWSSVQDMARWMIFLLEGGVARAGDPPLIARETLEELFTPQMNVGPDAFYPTTRLTRPHWTTYGLGWFQEDYRGRKLDFHTGSIDGMVAVIGLIRDERLGVYVLSNLDHAELRHALMYRVLDRFDQGPPRDWSAELLDLYGAIREKAEAKERELEESRVPGTRPSLPLSDYAGKYSDPLYGTLVVSEDQGLRLRYGPGLAGPLEHWHYDTFRVRWDAAWRGTALATFELDASGRPATVTIRGYSFHREDEPAGTGER